jgi:hypothetical protein
MTVTSDAVNTMIALNNMTTCDAVVFSTSSEKTGACIDVFCDGTYWYAVPMCQNTLTLTTS